jgi:DNA-binding NarL/FixJ family response regulator
MIRLLIAEDHALMREGLKQLLALFDDIEVAGEAVNGGDVMEWVSKGGLGLILLDMNMPGVSGVELITWICAQDQPVPILILSMYKEPHIAMRALKAGAAGYLTKDNEPETLISAIRKVAEGGQFIDPFLAEQMVFKGGVPGKRISHWQLSERELHILRELAKGMGINDIAKSLGISNKTVSTHKVRMMEKMDFGSYADLMRYAVAFGLVA